MLDPGMAALVADAFDLGDAAALSAAPVARGEQGLVWKLETTRGTWAVKQTLRPVDERVLRDAVAFADAARDNGVPSPRSVPSTDGRPAATIGGALLQVSEWVDLLPPDPRADPVAVGRTVAGLHRLRWPDRSPLDPWFTDPAGPCEWVELGRALNRAGAPFAGQFAGLLAEFVALDEWVRPPRDVRTCHRDLWADNLRPVAGGGLCVIDWQDCGPADPGYELAAVLFEFGDDDPARIRALYGSYLDNRGPGRVADRGDFSMLIAQLGHICRIACRDWLDPAARSTDRAHSADRFAEFVDRRYTRESLHRILDVTAPAGTTGWRSA